MHSQPVPGKLPPVPPSTGKLLCRHLGGLVSFTPPWEIIPLTRVVFRETLTVLSRGWVWASGAVTSLGSVKDILGAEFLDFLLVDFRLPVEIPLQLRLGLQMSCQHEQQGREQVLIARGGTAFQGWPWQ